ncbi:MAG: tRNA (N(6)-L-threonylcarbamoyladenosine(37)-C(2))-methylthiotransferase MtaB [Atopobiaceae bacterium]
MSLSGSARVSVVNLGCRVNRVELDLIASQLLSAGCELVDQAEAEAIVVNSCAVTAEAEAKTRKTIRHAAHLPQAPAVVATGCVASLFKDELQELAPNVVVEPDKTRVAERVLETLGLDATSVLDTGELAQSPTPTGRSRPGIKVQDGCDNRCTYCIVWKARGQGRSLASGRVIEAVQEAVARGAHEVVLTGINLGQYHTEDASRKMDLTDLLDEIQAQTTIERIRLSSIEPPDVTERLLEHMAASGGRVAPFLHICLQSGCDATLARMGRAYTTADFAARVEAARRLVPQIAIGTDLIVGFPGETDADFDASLAFCEQMSFAKMHIFRYSKRPGTPAATMQHQVEPHIMAERSRRLRHLADVMRAQEAARHVGEKDLVLVEYPGRGVSGGLFDVLVDPRLEVGSMVEVKLIGCTPDGRLKGTLLA